MFLSLCVFFCFHFYRLNIVWMALKKQSFISCGNRLFENTSVSNCNEEGNNFLISYTVLYFQGQSDNICDLPFLFFKKWTMIETFIYNTFFRRDLADNRVFERLMLRMKNYFDLQFLTSQCPWKETFQITIKNLKTIFSV